MMNNLPITIKIIHEADATEAPYVAYIPEFDISSCGEDENQAVKNARQALRLTLDYVKENGELDDFLHEHGFDSSPKTGFSFPKIITEPFAIA